MVNKVTLVGHLGQDPKLRRLPSGVAVASLRVATTERYKDSEGHWREETEWHDVTLWRAMAERAEQQLRKGMLVYVEGKLSYKTYEDRAGQPQRRPEVVAAALRLLRAADAPRDPGPAPRTPARPGEGSDALSSFLGGEGEG